MKHDSKNKKKKRRRNYQLSASDQYDNNGVEVSEITEEPKAPVFDDSTTEEVHKKIEEGKNNGWGSFFKNSGGVVLPVAVLALSVGLSFIAIEYLEDEQDEGVTEEIVTTQPAPEPQPEPTTPPAPTTPEPQEVTVQIPAPEPEPTPEPEPQPTPTQGERQIEPAVGVPVGTTPAPTQQPATGVPAGTPENEEDDVKVVVVTSPDDSGDQQTINIKIQRPGVPQETFRFVGPAIDVTRSIVPAQVNTYRAIKVTRPSVSTAVPTLP